MCRRSRRLGCSAELQTLLAIAKTSGCTRTVLPSALVPSLPPSDCGGLARSKRSVSPRTSHAGSPTRCPLRGTPAPPRLPQWSTCTLCERDACSMARTRGAGMRSRARLCQRRRDQRIGRRRSGELEQCSLLGSVDGSMRKPEARHALGVLGMTRSCVHWGAGCGASIRDPC
jgi:hypothetical protein